MRRIRGRSAGLCDGQAGKTGAARAGDLGGGGRHGGDAARHRACPHFQRGHCRRALRHPGARRVDQIAGAPTPRRAVLLGVLLGVAAGAKYIGILLLPFALAAIQFIPGPGKSRRVRRAPTVAGVAIAVFVLIELPALYHLAKLQRGLGYEYSHATQGHDVPISTSRTDARPWGISTRRSGSWRWTGRLTG